MAQAKESIVTAGVSAFNYAIYKLQLYFRSFVKLVLQAKQHMEELSVPTYPFHS